MIPLATVVRFTEIESRMARAGREKQGGGVVG